MMRTAAACALVLAFSTQVPAFSALPDPIFSFGESRIAASPKNLVVDPAFQYVYVFYLRDLNDNPVAGFPASQVQLDFSECSNANTRPSNLIAGDADSDPDGRIFWIENLVFGGADPCEIPVRVMNGTFYVIPGADHGGGLRNADEDGDGLVALSDIVAWLMAFVDGGPAWRGDLRRPFDDTTALADMVALQHHFVAE